MTNPFDIFKSAGIGDEEYSGLVKKSLPPLPSEEALLKMTGNEINDLRKTYHGYTEEQSVLSPVQHRKMNKSIVAEGGLLKSLLTVPAMATATVVYAGLKGANILPSDVDTGKEPFKEAVQGLIGVGEGLHSLFIPEGDTEIKREVSPEVQKHFDIKDQVDKILPNLINAESRGKHTTEGTLTTSEKGAKGITQILPSTAKNPGYGIKPLQNDTEEEYVRFGKDYLTKMISIFDNAEQGVAAYNAGPGAIHRAISKANRTGRDWKEFLPKETRNYLTKVLEEKVSSDNNTEFTAVSGIRN